MAVNLNVATFIKFALIVSLSFAVSVYLKQKIDLFWEQCRPPEEEKTTGWKSTVIHVWTWIMSSIWQWSHDWEENDEALSNEKLLVPPCQAPVAEILKHVILISVIHDISHAGEAVNGIVAGLCSGLQDALKTMSSAGKGIVFSLLDACAVSLQNIVEQLQTGLKEAWKCAVVAYTDIFSEQPGSLGTAFVIICISCLLASIFIYRRNRQLRQVQCNQSQKQPTLSQNRHTWNNSTPRSTRVDNSRTDVVCRFGAGLTPQRIKLESQHTGGGEGRAVSGERRTLMRWLLFTAVLVLCLSLPWEFCRLYQLAVARKAAVASAGVPSECNPETLSLLQSLALWLSHQLAWSHGDPCDRYYQAVLVDPIWEITPAMVLTSVIARSVVHPAEMLASGLGRAMRRFFSEIPLHWQPACLLLIVTFTFVLMLLTCSYRFSIPMLFRFEPKTPVLSCQENCGTKVRDRGRKDRKSSRLSDSLEFTGRSARASTETVDDESQSAARHQRSRDSHAKDPETAWHLSGHSDWSREVHDCDVQGESLVSDTENKPRTRTRAPRKLKSERADKVTPRAALHEIDMTSNKMSAIEVGVQRRPVKVKVPKQGRKTSLTHK